MEGGKSLFQCNVRRPGATDEAYRPGARAITCCCLLLHGNHFRAQRHPEITVRVHAQERFLGLAFDEIARPAYALRGNDGAEHAFVSLEPSALRHLSKARSQHFAQSLGWHRSLALCISAYWARPIPRSQPSMSKFSPLGSSQRQFLKTVEPLAPAANPKVS